MLGTMKAVHVRMSDELHRKLQAVAEAEKRSLNSQILLFLELATAKRKR
jgi:predicted HicB family RNase H-like nuclease